MPFNMCSAGLRVAERDGGAGLEALVRHAGGTLERAGDPRSAAGAANWVVLGADAPRERAWAAKTLPSGKGLPCESGPDLEQVH